MKRGLLSPTIAILGVLVFGPSFVLLLFGMWFAPRIELSAVLSAILTGGISFLLLKHLVKKRVPEVHVPAPAVADYAVPAFPAPEVPPGEPEPRPPTVADLIAFALEHQPFRTVPPEGDWALPHTRVFSRLTEAGAHVICLVDAHGDDAVRFAMDKPQLVKATEQLRAVLCPAGQPMLFELVEVRDIVVPSDEYRFSPLKLSKGGLTVRAYLVDEHVGIVGSNSSSANDVTRKFLTQLLRDGPWVGEQLILALETKVGVDARGKLPLLTIGMIATLIIAFAVELSNAIGPITGIGSPTPNSLVALGGLFPVLIREWTDAYRLWTPILLHGDGVHLLLNAASLWMSGVVLEPLVGRRNTLAIFLIGGLGGSLLSWATSGPNIVSVGASGAIMAMLAAAFVVSTRMPDPAERSVVQQVLARVLIPSLLPMLAVGGGKGVDVWAHVGGALTGAACGGLLLLAWRIGDPKPRGRGIAGIVAAVGMVCLLASVAQAAREYPAFALEYELAPNDQMPPTDDDALAKLPDLIRRFPEDPRIRRLQGKRELLADNFAGAEGHYRQVLADRRRLALFDSSFEERVAIELAYVIYKLDREAEARALAAPYCAPADGGSASELVTSSGLCP
jgi:rhomboid protease GluP